MSESHDSMTYQEWVKINDKKVDEILARLNLKTPEEIAKYFTFESMQKNEPDHCPLYKMNRKCHDTPDLNCYFCACPHFIINETPKTSGKVTIGSTCAINSRFKGEFFENPDENNVVKIHCDCTKCFVPHKTSYVTKMLNKDLLEMNNIKACSSLIDYVRFKQNHILNNLYR